MHEDVLLRMRQAARSREYVVTTHADDEMYDDDLSIHDVERVIATGQIVERQKDRQSNEWNREARDHHCLSTVTIGGGMKMTCEICGRDGARVRHVTRSYGKGADLLVIENVPIVSCPHCGGAYLTAETMHELDKIKSDRRTRATSRPVAVATY